MNRITKRIGGLLGLCVLSVGFTAVHGEEAGDGIERLKQDLQVLSSDEFEGRGIGTKGIDQAADYIARQFAAAGLDVSVAGGDAFQEFEVLDKAELGSPNTLAIVGPAGERIEGQLDTTFRTLSLSGTGHVTAPILFLGYGIDSSEPKYNDFDGIDVKGKVILVLRRTPQQGKKDGVFSDPHSGAGRNAELKTKISNAYRAGASAVLLVNDSYSGRQGTAELKAALEKAKDRVADAAAAVPATVEQATAEPLKSLADAVTHLRQVKEQLQNDDPDPLIKFGYAGTAQGDAIPVFHIRRALADQLLKGSIGKSLEELEQQIDDSGKPASADLKGWALEGEANVVVKMAPVRNVIGVLPGSGDLAKETVVVGAHYDHLGFGEEGSLSPGTKEIHNGADDNGSGTVAIIELARRLAADKTSPRRQIVFVAFTGEERGLLGSAEYVKSPLIPLESTVTMINLDMVGRITDDKLTVFGADTAPEFNTWLDDAAAKEKLTLIKKPEGFGPSDHSSFYARQIPVLHLFSGVHSDYHRPGDDFEKINFDGLAKATAFAEILTRNAATVAVRPKYVQVAGQAQLERTGSRPYLGSIPDFGTNEKGYALQGVSPGSPAEKGGLKPGDVIVRFGGQNIGNLDDFDLALRKFKAGEEVEVVVKRSGQEVPLKVTLGKPRS